MPRWDAWVKLGLRANVTLLANIFMQSPYIQGSNVEGPVGVVLAEFQGHANAMTISFFSEAAHHPTTLWACIAKSSYTHELISKAGLFSLIVLHEKQKEIALWCGSRSGRDEDKCTRLQIYRNPSGFLYLSDALVSVACRVLTGHDVGDHTLFISNILSGEIETRRSHLRHLLVSDLR